MDNYTLKQRLITVVEGLYETNEVLQVGIDTHTVMSHQPLMMAAGLKILINAVYTVEHNHTVKISVDGISPPVVLENIPSHAWLNLTPPCSIGELMHFRIEGACKLSVQMPVEI